MIGWLASPALQERLRPDAAMERVGALHHSLKFCRPSYDQRRLHFILFEVDTFRLEVGVPDRLTPSAGCCRRVVLRRRGGHLLQQQQAPVCRCLDELALNRRQRKRLNSCEARPPQWREDVAAYLRQPGVAADAMRDAPRGRTKESGRVPNMRSRCSKAAASIE